MTKDREIRRTDVEGLRNREAVQNEVKEILGSENRSWGMIIEVRVKPRAERKWTRGDRMKSQVEGKVRRGWKA